MADFLHHQRHSYIDDAQAILIGTAMIALALNLYSDSQLITGGAAGIALLAHYVSGYSVGTCFFIINIPFYYLAFKQMGKNFIARTFISIACLSLMTDQFSQWISFNELDPLFSALFGGCLIGLGFLLIFRHGASLGGINILTLYWQNKYKINAGKTQLAIDTAILASSAFITPLHALLYSLCGCLIVNLIMIFNFKGERYSGYSP
ncbi:putative 5xTM membrane BCR, YitT family [compost metagenome]